MQPEIVVSVDVLAQLHRQLVQRRETLPVAELRLQDLVGRLVHRVVVGAALLGERASHAESIQQLVYRRVVELRAPVGMEDLYIAQREIQRRERRFDQTGVLMRARRMPHDIAVVQVNQQTDAVPSGPHAHVNQVAHDVRARCVPVELPAHLCSGALPRWPWRNGA